MTNGLSEGGLRPCPHCGGEGKTCQNGGVVYVVCLDCHAQGPTKSTTHPQVVAEAVASWNGRRSLPGSDAREAGVARGTRRAYFDTIERLLKFAKAEKLSGDEMDEVDKIADEHSWDGLSCACGGGWLVGHLAGCPEAASPASPDEAQGMVTEATELRQRLQAILDWADLALAHPEEFNRHGVKNLDGPVFDEARAALTGHKP